MKKFPPLLSSSYRFKKNPTSGLDVSAEKRVPPHPEGAVCYSTTTTIQSCWEIRSVWEIAKRANK